MAHHMTKPLPKLQFGPRFKDNDWVAEDGTPADIIAEGVEFTRFADGSVHVMVGNRYEGHERKLSAEDVAKLKAFLS